jgi:Pyridine nucleotide-disulphide oxidoreductase
MRCSSEPSEDDDASNDAHEQHLPISVEKCSRFRNALALRCCHRDVKQTIVFNTGAGPSLPPLDGLEAVPVLDSTSIMEVDAVPPHLLVLGGGYVGLAFGPMFRRFGSAVPSVQRGARNGAYARLYAMGFRHTGGEEPSERTA